MTDDLRKNPRFLATDGVAARIFVGERELAGSIHDFSATGFSVVLEEPIEESGQVPIEVVFSGGKADLKLSALIINKKTRDELNTRLGCQITDMYDQSNAYFTFLTSIMFKQGFLKSMAKKPIKYIDPGSA